PDLECRAKADKSGFGRYMRMFLKTIGKDDPSLAVHRQLMRVGEELRQVFVFVRELFESFKPTLHFFHAIAAGPVYRRYAKGREHDDEVGVTMGSESGAKGRRHRNSPLAV